MTQPRLVCSVTPVASTAPDAELIVLGDSLGTTTALWDLVVPVLAQRFRVLRYDLPGHGFSPATTEPFSIAELADAVVDLVDTVGGGSFHYAGISLGGAVGIELALRHPHRLRSVAVICSAARIGTTEGWVERARQTRQSGTPSLVSTSAARWYAPGFFDRSPAIAAPGLTALLDIDDESYALAADALAAFDVRQALGDIRVPVLCVAGELDLAAPPEVVRETAELIGARFEQLPGVGHLPSLEAPAALAALVLDHAKVGAFARGIQVRREVLGDAHVDAANAKITPETADFQDFITRYAWGEIWTRPGLDRRTRSFLTLATLIGAGHENELAMHVRAALTNGLTRAEISEAILHTAIYASVPSANSAFAIARQVFAELDAAGD
ncbi:3-oxoadipate enol-lactonase [soil metagenome]